MLLDSHKPNVIDSFKGLYARGIDDTVPKGYYIDSLNTIHHQKEVKTRPGSSSVYTRANIRRSFIYKRLNESVRYIVLDTSGNLYDSLYNDPIGTNVSWTDFSAVNYFNRLYITFHNRVKGVTGTFLYVYEGGGPGTLRLAAGSPPSGFTLGVADSTNAGSIEVGTHLIAVAYETSSGFITAPGPELFAVYEAPGGFKADVTSIPIGPTGTVARWILGTRAIQDYDGNQTGYEFFFIPNGRIANNVDTTLEIDYFDADLFISADYLFDNEAQLTAGLGLAVYDNRLVRWGIPGFEHYVYVSRQLEPEVFDATNGFILIDPSDAITGVTNCIEFRNSLYIANRNRFYVTQSIQDFSPVNWSVLSVDKGVGTEVFGISRILDARGSNIDRFFVADRAGLYVFESGVFRKPQLSWNIEDLWKRINKAHFSKVMVDHDPEDFKVYVAIPLDEATECSHVLVADYQNAISPLGFLVPSEVKWDIWQFPWSVASMQIDLNSDFKAVLKTAGFAGNIYQMDESVRADDSTRIDSYIKTYLMADKPGYVHHYGFLQARVRGQGNLEINMYGLDNVENTTSLSFVLTSSPGTLKERRINFESDKLSIKLTADSNVNDWFQLAQLIVYVKPIWQTRPAEL